MSNARDKANIPSLNFSSTGIDDNATSTAITIDSSENVGIGTASPNNYAGYGNITLNGTSGGIFDLGVNGTRTGTLLALVGETRLSSITYIPLTFSTNNAERMRIDSSGNVGIGTTSPSSQSGDANDLVVGSGSGNNGLTIYSGTTSNGAIRFSDGTTGASTYIGQIDYDHNDNSLKFVTNAQDRMRINSSGELLVGTTTAPNISGAIHVANSSGHGLQITNTSASKNRRIYMASNGSLYFWNGTNEGFLSDAGAWTNASDERLKKNIRNIEYGLNTVLSTQPRHYERNDVEGTYIGFVAQELQKIVPEVVSGNPDKQLGVDYGSLVAVAFKAIQEQQTKIEELEARITALETNQP